MTGSAADLAALPALKGDPTNALGDTPGDVEGSKSLPSSAHSECSVPLSLESLL
jgi:hypothetical protein